VINTNVNDAISLIQSKLQLVKLLSIDKPSIRVNDSIIIYSHLTKMLGAINCLVEKNYIESALILTYAGIDQMAWLAVPDQETDSEHFKSWVDKYLDPQNKLGCTSVDLWAARCGLVHTAAAESRDFFRAKAKKIYYCSGDFICTENNSQDTVILNATTLIYLFVAGCVAFTTDLESNVSEFDNAVKKAGAILAYRPSL
jgi:hypothetical protein